VTDFDEKKFVLMDFYVEIPFTIQFYKNAAYVALARELAG
jgi:hypothetical protein